MVNNVNAQEWLVSQEEYNTKEKRAQVEELNLSDKNLEGDLDLADFTDLEKLIITGNPHLGEVKNVNPETTVVRWKNVQEWLDKKYSSKEAEKIDFTTLDTDLKKMEFGEPGELKIEGFEKLTEIKKGDRDFHGVKKIVISNCPKIEKIDVNSFKDNRELVLEGEFSNLTHLDCSSSKLEKIDVSKCSNLTELYCHNNRLTDITLPENTNNLQELVLLNNNFKRSAYTRIEYLATQVEKAGIISYDKDLSFLKNYTKLKKLYLGNFTNHEDPHLKKCDEERGEDVYNRFSGSLKNLKELKNLEVLDISNTDIDLGFNYLPSKIKEIYCSSEGKPGSRVKKIENKLGKSPFFAYLNNRYIRKTDAQTWIDENYPENALCKNKYDKENIVKKRREITKLDIKEWGLAGKIDLSDFENLKELDCSNNQITELILNKNTKLFEINCSTNNLMQIDLNNNKELTVLNCSNNNLTKLNLKELKKLKELNCDNNSLTNFYELVELNPDNLTSLNISNNRFSKLRLSAFKKFVNLEKLYLGNTKKDKNNQFRGSLEPLKELFKLKELDISNTGIVSGLEYLPKDFRRLYCNNENKTSESSKFAEVLNKYSTTTDENDREYYEIDWWRKDKEYLLRTARLEDIQKDIRRVFDRRRKEDIEKLEDPKELRKEGNKLDTARSVGRGVSIATGALSFAGGAFSYNSLSLVGGGIAVLYPIVEMRFIEEWEKEYTDKKEKWDEFARDTKKLWHDYQDLVGILRPFETYTNLLDENDKEEDRKLKELWKEFKKILGKEKPIEVKELFDKDLKDRWRGETNRKKQWKDFEEKLAKVSGKVAESEELSNQQQMIDNKEKNKKNDESQSELKAIIVENRDYGSFNNK